MKRSAAKPLRVLLALSAAAAAVWGLAGIRGTQEQTRYYPETGHTIDAIFLEFFGEHGGEDIIGFPITDSFLDPESGFTIQYFENARMELVPSSRDAASEVRFAPIGEELGGWQTPSEADYLRAKADPGCTFFPATQHAVCHAFLDYYEDHNGPEVFGYPISEFTFEDENVVQYFQRFRLDWDENAPRSEQVVVAPLGIAHFELMGYDPSLLQAHRPEVSYNNQAINLRLESSVTSPVLSSTDTQRIFITVRDQNLNPITNAAVMLTAQFPERERVFLMPPTDAGGLSQLELHFEEIPAGEEILLEFLVIFGDIKASTRDSFRIW